MRESWIFNGHLVTWPRPRNRSRARGTVCEDLLNTRVIQLMLAYREGILSTPRSRNLAARTVAVTATIRVSSRPILRPHSFWQFDDVSDASCAPYRLVFRLPDENATSCHAAWNLLTVIYKQRADKREKRAVKDSGWNKNTDEDARCKMAICGKARTKMAQLRVHLRWATHQLLEIKLGIIGFLLLSLLLNDRLELILILLSS